MPPAVTITRTPSRSGSPARGSRGGPSTAPRTSSASTPSNPPTTSPTSTPRRCTCSASSPAGSTSPGGSGWRSTTAGRSTRSCPDDAARGDERAGGRQRRMLRIDGRRRAACDGITRRTLLEAAGAGLLGLGLPGVLGAEARGGDRPSARARSVIFLYLFGGPSQLETFDLKPAAPDRIRGPFRPI